MDKYRWQANFYFTLWLLCIISSLIQSWLGYTASERLNQNVIEMRERSEKRFKLIDESIQSRFKQLDEMNDNLLKKEQF